MSKQIRQMPRLFRLSWAVLLVCGVSWHKPAVAETIFDNSVNDGRAVYQFAGTEKGDEIQLAGTARYLTNFSFRYVLFATNSPQHVAARVRFYVNDGAPDPWDIDAVPKPGTVFFDTGSIALPSGIVYGTLTLSAGSEFPTEGLFLPSAKMTWSIQYQGLMSGETGGVLLYRPAVVGVGSSNMWSNGDGWARQPKPEALNFNAIMQADKGPSPYLNLVRTNNQAAVSWPSSAVGWRLQTNSSLGASGWGDYAGTIINNTLTNLDFGETVFFRLISP